MPPIEQSAAMPAISVLLYLTAIVCGAAVTKFKKISAGLCFVCAFAAGVIAGWYFGTIFRFSVSWTVVVGMIVGFFSMYVAVKIYSQRDEW